MNKGAAMSMPGWYPDPSGAPGLRYFDGARWTDQLMRSPNKKETPKWPWIVGAVAVLFLIGLIGDKTVRILSHPPTLARQRKHQRPRWSNLRDR